MLSLLLSLVVASSARAETIQVTTTDPAINAEISQGVVADCDSEAPADTLTLELLCPDGSGGHTSPCDAPDISLAEAICAANASPGQDTIVLQAGATYTLTEAHNSWLGYNALPFITSDITIVGEGATIERDASAPDFRLFAVSGAYTEYAAPTVGQTAPFGSLTLSDLTLRDGSAKGGSGGYAAGGGAGLGGAIFSMGDLTLVRVSLLDNTAQGGSAHLTAFGNLGGGGLAGSGADYGGGGFGTPVDAVSHPNSGQGGGFGAAQSPGAYPHGRFATGGASQSLTDTVAYRGGFGAGGATNWYRYPATTGGFGGGGAAGGGSTFAGGQSSIDASTGGWGGDAYGGAVFHMDGTLRMENCTVAGNRALGGVTARPTLTSGSSWAGGVAVLNGTAHIALSTFAHNEADATSDLLVRNLTTAPPAAVGGTQSCFLYDGYAPVCTPTTSAVEVTRSVFASDGLEGPVRSAVLANLTGSGNLVSAASASLPQDFTLVDASFSVLDAGDFGGQSFTIPLPVDQPVAPGDCLGLDGLVATDQRGRERPATDCDPGAYQRPASCSLDTECEVGACVEGVCCTGCDGLDAGCAVCTEANGAIAEGICTVAEAGSPCGDAGTQCVVQDTCDAGGLCVDQGFEADGTACDDDLWCTAEDSCSAGACIGAGEACAADETCIEATDSCSVNCGDGEITDGEECDDGEANSDYIHDACRSDCTLPRCGDGIVDSGEQCDGGYPEVPCAPDCTIIFPDPPEDTGTADSGGSTRDGCGCTHMASPPGGAALWLVFLPHVLRRRSCTDDSSRPQTRPP